MAVCIWGILLCTTSDFLGIQSCYVGGGRDGCLFGSKNSTMKPHVTWGQAPAQLPKRVLTDSGGDNIHLLNYANEATEPYEVRRAFEKAPRAPIEGASAVSMFKENLHVDLIFRDDLITLREKNSLLIS